MQLLFTNCIPMITYGCAVKKYSSREMSDCNTAVNDAIRKNFSFQRWQSTRELREHFGYPSLHESFAKAKNKFRLSLENHSNFVLSSLFLITAVVEEDEEDSL